MQQVPPQTIPWNLRIDARFRPWSTNQVVLGFHVVLCRGVLQAFQTISSYFVPGGLVWLGKLLLFAASTPGLKMSFLTSTEQRIKSGRPPSLPSGQVSEGGENELYSYVSHNEGHTIPRIIAQTHRGVRRPRRNPFGNKSAGPRGSREGCLLWPPAELKRGHTWDPPWQWHGSPYGHPYGVDDQDFELELGEVLQNRQTLLAIVGQSGGGNARFVGTGTHQLVDAFFLFLDHLDIQLYHARSNFEGSMCLEDLALT